MIDFLNGEKLMDEHTIKDEETNVNSGQFTMLISLMIGWLVFGISLLGTLNVVGQIITSIGKGISLSTLNFTALLTMPLAGLVLSLILIQLTKLVLNTQK